jgi:thymidine kinase
MPGKIEVITGPMFSGKTTELLRRLERYILAGKSYAAIKSAIDTRKQEACIKTVRGVLELTLKPIHNLYCDTACEVIVIDEAQFFDEEIIEFCQIQKDKGVVLLISGLDMDYKRQPFGYMGQLMSIADSVTKLTAICSCGKDAIYTKKIAGSSKQIEIGDKDKYIPCCADCY